MFSIVEYRILILFDRLFILGNATEPCFCLRMSCSSSLQWVFFSSPSCQCASMAMNSAITDTEMSLLNCDGEWKCCSLGHVEHVVGGGGKSGTPGQNNTHQSFIVGSASSVVDLCVINYFIPLKIEFVVCRPVNGDNVTNKLKCRVLTV